MTNNDVRFYDVPTLLTGGAPLQTITGTQRRDAILRLRGGHRIGSRADDPHDVHARGRVLSSVDDDVHRSHSVRPELRTTTPLNAVDVFALGAQHYLVTTTGITGELYTLSAAIFANASVDIPTTSEWGLLAILLMLGATAVIRLRG